MRKWIILFTLLSTFSRDAACHVSTPIAAGFTRIVFSVDNSSTGYQLLLDADANTFSALPLTDLTMMSLPYREFEYKIPVDANGAYNTNRVVKNDTVTLDIPAGKYDFFTVYPSLQSRNIALVWTGRGDDYIFEAGKIYTFDVSGSGTLQLRTWDVHTPSAPSALSATVQTDGAFSCTLHWTNPATSMDGAPLESLSKITILRDGEIIDAVNSPVAGAVASYTDVSVNNGTHTYSVYATNEAINSDRITRSVLVSNANPCDGVTIFPFEEKFDDFVSYTSYPCWSIYNPDGDSFSWGRNTGNPDARSGSAIGHRRPDSSGNTNQDGWLVSPKIVVP